MTRISSYVERLLDRISNGTLAEDRRNAIAELQSVVAESRAAQLAFGAMGEHFLLEKIVVYLMLAVHNVNYSLVSQAFLYF